MATIIQRQDSAVLDQQKSTNIDSLSRVIVIKLLVDIDKFSLEFEKLKYHLEILVDEPVTFVVKDRDRVSEKILQMLGYSYTVLSLDEIRSLKPCHVIALFVFEKYTFKVQKIMEIICNKKFSKSILLV